MTTDPTSLRARPSRRLRIVRAVFSAQATSLLLVIAVLLLAYITVQARQAATGARMQSITNNTILRQQVQSDRQADLSRKEAAVRGAELAAKSVDRLIASTKTSDTKNFAILTARLIETQKILLKAIQDLQDTLRRYIEEDRRRDSQTIVVRPTSAPAPTPSCILCLPIPPR